MSPRKPPRPGLRSRSTCVAAGRGPPSCPCRSTSGRARSPYGEPPHAVISCSRSGETMAYPADLKYTQDHEWIRIVGDTAEVGITDFAQQQLGDVVYVELPDVGRALNAGDVFGSIESVKAVSELFAPMTGEVIEVNPHLKDHPDAVNSNPHA